MRWPTPQDYNEAIQNPSTNFANEELKQGTVEVDALGLPRPVTGAFASVYKVNCPDRSVAVRCFLRRVPDQQERYRMISDFILNDVLPYTVDFEFIDKGIRVAGSWYPILRMEWVDGLLLPQYIEKHLHKPEKLAHLDAAFHKMIVELKRDGIAHGDLQHGNIMVVGDEIRLVDYDGMYVPALEAFNSIELGHRNYQHPRRTGKDFGVYLDNFSAAVISTSLHALTIDPTLWTELDGGDECLLFRQTDYKDPYLSRAFALLENHANDSIRTRCRYLRSLLKLAPYEVPLPTGEIADPINLPAMPAWDSCAPWLRSTLANGDDGEIFEGCESATVEPEAARVKSRQNVGYRPGGHPVHLKIAPPPAPKSVPATTGATHGTGVSTGSSSTRTTQSSDVQQFVQIVLFCTIGLPFCSLCILHWIAHPEEFVGLAISTFATIVLIALLGGGAQLLKSKTLRSDLSKYRHMMVPVVCLFTAVWLCSLSTNLLTFVVFLIICGITGLLLYGLAHEHPALFNSPGAHIARARQAYSSFLSQLSTKVQRSPISELLITTGGVGLVCFGSVWFNLLWASSTFIYMLFVVGPVLCWYVFYWYDWRARYMKYLESQPTNNQITTKKTSPP